MDVRGLKRRLVKTSEDSFQFAFDRERGQLMLEFFRRNHIITQYLFYPSERIFTEV